MDFNCRVKCFCVINLSTLSKHGILSLVVENPKLNYYISKSQTNKNHTQFLLFLFKRYTHNHEHVISLLVTSTYPMTSAMRLLKQIEELLKKQIQSGKYEFQPLEPNLLTQYDRDPFTDNKIELTYKSVDSIQGLMEENIRKFQMNQEQLHVIHHKSADISWQINLKKRAIAVNNKQNWIIYLTIGIFCALVIGVIIYIFL